MLRLRTNHDKVQSMLSIASPFPQFFDLDGSPLDAGNVYIGIAGDNPQTVPQPVLFRPTSRFAR